LQTLIVASASQRLVTFDSFNPWAVVRSSLTARIFADSSANKSDASLTFSKQEKKREAIMRWPERVRLAVGALAVFVAFTLPVMAQDTPVGPEGTQVATQETPVAAANADELRKEAQNPVASLISVPVQNNVNGGIFPGNRNQDVLNVQPVIPLKVNDDWNLIIRWITPIIYQPLPVPASSPQLGVSGLGDMQPTFLLSPRKPHKIIWGLGPIFQLPTATSRDLGQGKLGIGPNLVVLAMPSHFVLGVLVNNIWSVAGGGNRPDINQMLLQYFVNYNMKKGWYLTTQPIITANWNSPAPSGGVWTVPFGGGVGRIMKLGFQPVNISVQAYGNAVHVPGASPWTVRATFALLFPKLTSEQKKMLLEQKLKQLEQEPPQKN
jgi:hypothetical protein